MCTECALTVFKFGGSLIFWKKGDPSVKNERPHLDRPHPSRTDNPLDRPSRWTDHSHNVNRTTHECENITFPTSLRYVIDNEWQKTDEWK